MMTDVAGRRPISAGMHLSHPLLNHVLHGVNHRFGKCSVLRRDDNIREWGKAWLCSRHPLLATLLLLLLLRTIIIVYSHYTLYLDQLTSVNAQ